MTITTLVISACLTIGSAMAAAPEWLGKVRKDHPRLFFNADTWPQLVERSKGSAAENLKRMLERCDAYPEKPVCTGTGEAVAKGEGFVVDTGSTAIDSISEWGDQAAECALAWRFTGDRKYLEKAKAMLRANVKGYQEAIAARRAVNWRSYTRINSLCAYDWIYNDLTDAERREIVVPLVQHVEDVQPRKGRPKIRRLNASGIRSGCYGVKNLMFYAGLAALGDGYCDELAEKLIVEGREFIDGMLKFRVETAGDDGALGTGAIGYAMNNYPVAHFGVFHCWRSATGENLAEQYPTMALFPNWIWWSWIPNPRSPVDPFNFGYGDTYHAKNEMSSEGLYENMLQYAGFFGKADPTAARLASSIAELAPNRKIGRVFPVYPFLFGADVAAKPLSMEELRKVQLKARHFECLGQVLMRSGWEDDSTYALFVGGTRVFEHKHYDEGHFAIFKHDPLALDTGCRAGQTDWNLKYYYSQSVAHNVVLIQQPGEKLPDGWGPKYNGPEGKTCYGGMSGKTSEIVAFETHPEYTYVAGDATATYGKKCTECVRQFVHIQPDYFIVYDRVGAADAKYAKQWLLHTQNEPVIEGRIARADSRRGRLFCETLLPQDAEIVKLGGSGKEFWANGKNWELAPKWRAKETAKCVRDDRGPYWGEWRMETHPGTPRKDDRFLHVLTAGDTNVIRAVSAKLVTEGNRDGVKLTLPGDTEVTVLFNRSGKVGGEIRFGDRRMPLTEKVMKQSGVMLDPKDNPPRKVLVGTLCRRFAGTPEERAGLAERHVDELAARAKREYGGRGLDLVVLPEHAIMREGKRAEEKTVPIAFVKERIGACARRNGCYVAVGVFLVERVEGRDLPRNALVIFDRKGEIVGVYNKVHTACEWGDPTTTESENGIAPGGGFPVFETDFGKVGALVCFDMSYDDGWQELKAGGAEIVVVSSMSPQVFRPSLYAHRHSYWVVTATPHSAAAVISPIGFVKEKVGSESSLLTEIDLSYVTLHWSPQLKGGKGLADKFGADAFGSIYIREENNGIFWSNRPDLPIGKMIEAVNIRPRDDEAARAERVAAGNRVPKRGEYQ